MNCILSIKDGNHDQRHLANEHGYNQAAIDIKLPRGFSYRSANTKKGQNENQTANAKDKNDERLSHIHVFGEICNPLRLYEDAGNNEGQAAQDEKYIHDEYDVFDDLHRARLHLDLFVA